MTEAHTHPEVVDLLARLIACPSVNPGDREPGGIYGEKALAEMLAAMLTEWGGEARIDEPIPGRTNLLVRFPGGRADRPVMFEAHLDTVSVEGMTIPPFEAAVQEGKVFGRGSCDTKGPMAAMLCAIRRLLDAEGGLPVEVWFLGTFGEEIGLSGARHAVAAGLPPSASVVVAEPTDLAVVTSHKGAYRATIVTHGLSAHSSEPARGVNAIAAMARVIDAIQGPLGESLAARAHPVLGPATVSVGVIRGGSQVNVVPDRCEMEVDRRVLPGESRRDVVAGLADVLDGLGRADPSFRAEIREDEWFPPFEQPADAPIVRAALAAGRKILGDACCQGVQYGSDASIYREAGIATVLLGPGSIAQAHKADEFIEIAPLLQAVDVYAELIHAFGRER